MSKIEVITLFNANNLPSAKQLALGQLQASLLGTRLTAALEIPNNSLTHSLTIEERRAGASRYGFLCRNAREAAVFFE
jgi:hypothetical protein